MHLDKSEENAAPVGGRSASADAAGYEKPPAGPSRAEGGTGAREVERGGLPGEAGQSGQQEKKGEAGTGDPSEEVGEERQGSEAIGELPKRTP